MRLRGARTEGRNATTYAVHSVASEEDPLKSPAVADISVIVLSYGPRPTLPAAVRSLIMQGDGAEIVVVHSGSGSARAMLEAEGLHVRVVENAARLTAAGARNVGISSTQGRYVAFLADDCKASSNWLRTRLAAHGAGAIAVASALLCHAPHNPIALAAHLCLYIRRMPEIDPAHALAYGASYDRRLFVEHGLFQEALESGEDTEFNSRLAPADQPIWHPDVRTIHVGETKLLGFMADQYRRGGRMARAGAALAQARALDIAVDAIRRCLFTVKWAGRVVDRAHSWSVFWARPLIMLGALAYALGACIKSPPAGRSP